MNSYKLPELRDFSSGTPAGGTMVRVALETADPVLFELEAKSRGFRYPRTPNLFPVKPRRLPHSSKPFSPKPEQIGSWVTFSSSGVELDGQIWALAPRPRHVWVATGEACHSVHIDDLRLSRDVLLEAVA